MKTNFLKTGLIAIFVIAFCVANADTFHSTTVGGDWTDLDTWEENAVPSASDDVIITSSSTVYVDINNAECYNITVETGATLRNKNNQSRILFIYGDIINNGIVTTPNSSLTLNIYGNIDNNGVWSNYSTNFTGLGSHTITQGAGYKFSGEDFNAADTTGQITALSDITFDKTDIDLNGVTLIISEGKRLTVTGATEPGNAILFKD
ncbi:MAG: hypothetical protein DRJ05_08935, partial [Bacteroidetes bacterium]